MEKILIFPEVSEKKMSYCEYTNTGDFLKNNKDYKKEKDIALVATSEENTVSTPFNHGLLGTIYKAYSYHVPLTLRPDDIWLSICIGFGNYVTAHAEEMRKCFVSHEGKKEISVEVPPSFDFSSEKHWETFFLPNIQSQIKSNTTPDLVEWLIPSFTTTTELDKIISSIVLMGTVKEYFSFSMEMGCGLSKLTLKGTKKDWEDLIIKIQKLKTFEQKHLTEWSQVLEEILVNFVNAYDDKIDSDFWQRICTSVSRGSGGQSSLRGWFLAFYPFNKGGQYILDPIEDIRLNKKYATIEDDDIADCKISAPVKLNDCGIHTNVNLIAGSVLGKYDEVNNNLSPSWFWTTVSVQDHEPEKESYFSKYMRSLPARHSRK